MDRRPPPATPAAPADGSLVRARWDLGPDTEILVLSDGVARFDGGAMFGVVPKTLWSRVTAADDENRIAVGLNTAVVRTKTSTGVRTVVIETGFGEKLPPKLAAIYGVQARLPEAFAAAGIPLASVNTVINTHLHWDHCGWNTRFFDGGVRATFPHAQYFAHAGEIRHGRAQLERDGISYVANNYEPLLASGQMQPLSVREGEVYELAPGIAVELYPGHTRQLMAVHIRDSASGKQACYISDLLPTTAHLPLAWTLGFDLDPVRTIAEKKRFYTQAIREGWLVLFTHDRQTPGAYLQPEGHGAKLLDVPHPGLQP